MIDHCIITHSKNDKNNNNENKKAKIPKHSLLLECCSGRSFLLKLKITSLKNERFSIKELIMKFGQTCNAASYLHA